MCTVKGKYWIVRNGVKQDPAPDRNFHSAMGMLRWALKSGEIRRRGAWGNTVPGPGEMERVSIPYAGSNDWRGDYYFSLEQVEAMGKALTRYRGILRYFREVYPGWKEVDRIHYMDNSIISVQEDRFGNRREVTVEHPHGGICF
ncbi:hypothetical protein ABT282_07395 [Streptomyces sp. NPDC000927]|uniref:hypothetical protein n=1 Tax=Streptomyces sp. NPDC000927 TaxID=3154371 RepID=UPI00332129A9